MKQLTNNEINNVFGGLDKTYACEFVHVSKQCQDDNCTTVIDNTITATLTVKTTAEIPEQNQYLEKSVGELFGWVSEVSPGYAFVSCKSL